MRGQGAWWLAGAIAAALWVTGARAETGATDRNTGTSASDMAQQAEQSASDSAKSAGHEAKDTAKRAASSARSTASEAGTGTQAGATTAGEKLSASWKKTIEKMHLGNQAQIDAGTYMRDRTTNDEVKNFASRMVSDHTALDADLSSFAQDRGMDLTAMEPKSAKARMEKELSSIRKASGPAADRAYAKLMVQEHTRDVKEAKSAAKKAKGEQQTELATLLDNAATKLEDHLSEARKLEKDLTQRQAKARPSRSGSTGTGSSSQRGNP